VLILAKFRLFQEDECERMLQGFCCSYGNHQKVTVSPCTCLWGSKPGGALSVIYFIKIPSLNFLGFRDRCPGATNGKCIWRAAGVAACRSSLNSGFYSNMNVRGLHMPYAVPTGTVHTCHCVTCSRAVGMFLALNAAVYFVTGVSLQLARQLARSQTTCCSSARTLSLG
jgi:hypothetical protein